MRIELQSNTAIWEYSDRSIYVNGRPNEKQVKDLLPSDTIIIATKESERTETVVCVMGDADYLELGGRWEVIYESSPGHPAAGNLYKGSPLLQLLNNDQTDI